MAEVNSNSSPITKQAPFNTIKKLLKGKGILLLCGENVPQNDVRNQLLDQFEAKGVTFRQTRNLDLILCYPCKASLNKDSLVIMSSWPGIEVLDAEEIGMPFVKAYKSKINAKKRKRQVKYSPTGAEKQNSPEAIVIKPNILPQAISALILLGTPPAPTLFEIASPAQGSIPVHTTPLQNTAPEIEDYAEDVTIFNARATNFSA